jgi:hypothetical protein
MRVSHVSGEKLSVHAGPELWTRAIDRGEGNEWFDEYDRTPIPPQYNDNEYLQLFYKALESDSVGPDMHPYSTGP